MQEGLEFRLQHNVAMTSEELRAILKRRRKELKRNQAEVGEALSMTHAGISERERSGSRLLLEEYEEWARALDAELVIQFVTEPGPYQALAKAWHRVDPEGQRALAAIAAKWDKLGGMLQSMLISLANSDD